MFSLVLPASFAVLHVPQGVTLGEYLFRVLVYLLAFAGIGVATFGGIRTIELVRSAVGDRW